VRPKIGSIQIESSIYGFARFACRSIASSKQSSGFSSGFIP
jgi:hypothetical protein